VKQSKLGNSGSLKTVLFLGSTRDGRFGSRVGLFVKKLLEEEYGHEVDLIGIAIVYHHHRRVVSIMIPEKMYYGVPIAKNSVDL
jgi:hypothetical protein